MHNSAFSYCILFHTTNAKSQSESSDNGSLSVSSDPLSEKTRLLGKSGTKSSSFRSDLKTRKMKLHRTSYMIYTHHSSVRIQVVCVHMTL